MNSNAKRWLYYWIIGIGGVFFIVSGFFEITKNPVTYLKTLSMGYPPYFITTLGIAKIIGIVALWLPYYKRLKEWVFAGLTFDVIFAFISALHIGSAIDCTKSAIAFVMLMFAYSLWQKQGS